jgi:Methyltransferase domain
MNLIRVEKTIEQVLPTLDGWCTPEKGKRMAALTYGANLAVELGVFGGRSLAAMAFACKDQGFGVVHGIDPFTAEASLDGTDAEAHREYWSKIDHESIFRKTKEFLHSNGLESHARIVRKRSIEAMHFYKDNAVDILHQDSNHSEENSCKEVLLWHKKIRPGGYWIADDTDAEHWKTTQKSLTMLSELGFELVEDHQNWRVYTRCTTNLP